MSNALHPAHQFRSVVESKASDFLQAMVGTEEGSKAAGRVALAFRQAAQTNDRLYSCDPVSVAQAVALSAMTGLMPGGPLPDVYLLPRGKILQWQVSHRGFAKLAARSGVRLRTKAVFESDTFHVIEGTDPNLAIMGHIDSSIRCGTLHRWNKRLCCHPKGRHRKEASQLRRLQAQQEPVPMGPMANRNGSQDGASVCICTRHRRHGRHNLKRV